eukprot:CAMPEP_0116114560 /NCGR_PEP_ID=MMETSP0329-20121206/45_1 /TAXON_ID=697910 /ORGANISM="Pseudo-nitzschia arenysensis, Strain B593" /LENGTH=543 /DNA_ID=CAMNT_0003607947 /DNA_START=111 /DNA_END=1743 /DNA_ORIENTATION=-
MEFATPLDSSGRRILICCFGSRGDIQPFAALARGLQDDGFTVLGMTNVNDGVSIFSSVGVEAEGVHFDMAHFLRTDPKMKKAMETGNPIQFGIAMSNTMTNHFPKELSTQFEVAKKFQPHLILAHTHFSPASAIGQALRVPVVHADLGIFSFLPISKHTETEFHEPKSLHKAASFVCVASMTIALRQKNKDKDSIDRAIRRELFSQGGLDPTTERYLGQDGAGQFAREWMNPLTPNLFAVSDSVLPKSEFTDLPPLYAERSIWTGNWFVSKKLQEELAESGDPNFSNKKEGETDTVQNLVQEFLQTQKRLREAAGQPSVAPAYIGWGSMVAVSAKHMTRVAVKSLQLADLPGIVLGGFAQLHMDLLKGEADKALYEYAQKHVLFLQSAPHEWLFPQCSVTVHHGGAGTTAAALRSGVPTIVTPCIADQFDNAALVTSSGCGIGFKKSLRKITEAQLAAAMTQCVTSCDEQMLSSCQRVSQALEKEDGIANAVREIDTFWKEKLDTGQWKKEFEARLEQRAKVPWSTWRAMYRLMFYKEPFVEE